MHCVLPSLFLGVTEQVNVGFVVFKSHQDKNKVDVLNSALHQIYNLFPFTIDTEVCVTDAQISNMISLKYLITIILYVHS